MSRADELQAALNRLKVEMIAKLGLEPGDDWTDFYNERDEPLAWRQHHRLLRRLEAERSGVPPVPPA